MSENEKPASWWFAGYEEDEIWSGPHPTRDDAIVAGQVEYGAESFVLRQARRIRPFPPDASMVLEAWCEQEGLSEYADPDHGFAGLQGEPDAVKAATEDLQRRLDDWCHAHAALIPDHWALDFVGQPETVQLAFEREDG